jgi:hypothetical protein
MKPNPLFVKISTRAVILVYFCNYRKIGQSKQRPKRRKFVQSGHPGRRMLSCKKKLALTKKNKTFRLKFSFLNFFGKKSKIGNAFLFNNLPSISPATMRPRGRKRKKRLLSQILNP